MKNEKLRENQSTVFFDVKSIKGAILDKILSFGLAFLTEPVPTALICF